ncbi:ATP-binding cassette domain-containing protein [Natronobeatus ordinarius]|uniref:ATP-binding cassette domain-containing protein n=1 Tax=Natronobeatus ordinarius TaxID=2963433 RepID=UPI0020CEA5CA|nr:ATP-binding cassette domain-containing protein [Natronobeatus ordinarius]
MIDVDSISVSYGDVSVLRDVSFDVDRGEFVGLVGPNGAGKTTLLRTISGVLTPDSGTVDVDGVGVDGLSSRASSRLVSVVPQDTHLSFAFDVRDVVEMGRHPHRSRFGSPTPEDRATVDRALERTRTAELADRSIDAVSGGERQRVLLARTIAQDTPVVLLDEPTASLDVNHQVETLDLVRELTDDGKTAVAAIHDLDLAARYCDRLVVLADGVVCGQGPAEDVLSAETISRAFDATAAVTTNPFTGTPTVTALSSRASDEPVPGPVHVLGSGETAATVVARLEAAGVDVSVGPVSRGDVAATVARRLAVDRLTVEPFAPLSRDALATLENRLYAAACVVLADLEVGAGNQLVLEALSTVSPTLVVVETRPFAERNHAGERAERLYDELRQDAVEATPAGILDGVARALDDGNRRIPRSLEADDD